MKIADRIFAVLLILATCGHVGGTIVWLQPMTGLWVWSLGASLAGFLLGALHILRVNRPGDRPIAYLCLAGSICWAFVALSFNKSIDNMADPRGLSHAIIALVLACFSLRTLLLSSGQIETSEESLA